MRVSRWFTPCFVNFAGYRWITHSWCWVWCACWLLEGHRWRQCIGRPPSDVGSRWWGRASSRAPPALSKSLYDEELTMEMPGCSHQKHAIPLHREVWQKFSFPHPSASRQSQKAYYECNFNSVINNKKQTWPQGSIFRPHLYLIVINYI